ncbi:MAG: serine/threonine protein kinase [Proteobacteria bacterium]|nr:serine/threonine protein kinase [Pseudomonadota bacterium]
MDQSVTNSHLDLSEDSAYESTVPYLQSVRSPRELDSQIPTPPALSQKYRFIKEIGHGAQGRIYLAEHIFTHTKVSIKQFNIHSVKTWKEYDLFKREAQVLASLHINGVARFYEAIERLEDEPPCSFIIQEFIEGDSLQTMLKRGHRFSMVEICDMIMQILYILHSLHNHTPPVIHRDIKPSNLMLTPLEGGGYHVTIIDFGAVSNPQIQGGGSTVAGTYGYMPPEQMTGHTVPASDIYAVGAVAVQLFTGKAPSDLEVKDFRIIFEPEMEDKPHALVATLRSMLDPKVETRQADIRELIRLFHQFRANQFEIQNKKTEEVHYEPTYEEKLNKVNFIGQEGNLELWDGLPDSTNRDMIALYTHYLKTLSANTNRDNGSSEDDYYAFEDKKQVSARNKSFALVLFFMAFWGAVTVFSLYITKLTGWHAILFIFIMGIPCMIVALVEYNRLKVNRTRPFLASIYHHREYRSILKGEAPLFQELIQSGRKAIATIVDVQYINTPSYNVEDNPKGKLRKFASHLACHDDPAFLIRYKFNPPDDVRSEDLVHNYITYGEPEYHYRVGDRLPVLYTIYNSYFNQVVSSMPFPLPIYDLRGFHDIIYRSYAVDTRQEVLKTNLCFDVKLDYVLDQLNPEIANKLCSLNDIIVRLKPKKSYKESDIYQIDRELFCLHSDNPEVNALLVPYHTYYLFSHKFHELHRTIMSVLAKMAFPERKFTDKLLSRNKPIEDAVDAIRTYLSLKPRSYVLPDFGAIAELCLVYNRGALPDEMVNLLFQVRVDGDANPELRRELGKLTAPVR